MRRRNLLLTGAVIAASIATGAAAQNRERHAYFGDLHVHTKLSFDAYIFNVRATPDDAYRYATDRKKFERFVTDTTVLPSGVTTPGAGQAAGKSTGTGPG